MATANKQGMRTINIHQAKTHLSRLVSEVVEGESFIIAKSGKPMARLIPLEVPEVPATRRIGSLKGMYSIPDNFDEIDKELDKEVERLFLGEDAG